MTVNNDVVILILISIIVNIRTCDGKVVGGRRLREAGRRQLCSTEGDFVLLL